MNSKREQKVTIDIFVCVFCVNKLGFMENVWQKHWSSFCWQSLWPFQILSIHCSHVWCMLNLNIVHLIHNNLDGWVHESFIMWPFQLPVYYMKHMSWQELSIQVFRSKFMLSHSILIYYLGENAFKKAYFSQITIPMSAIDCCHLFMRLLYT